MNLEQGIQLPKPALKVRFLGSGAASGLDSSSLSEIPSFLTLRRQETKAALATSRNIHDRSERKATVPASTARTTTSAAMVRTVQLPSSISLQDAPDNFNINSGFNGQPMATTTSMSLDATELANHTLMRSCVLGTRSYTSIIFAIIYLPLSL
jgi:hypothetical protein